MLVQTPVLQVQFDHGAGRSRYVEPVYAVNTLANNVGVETPYEGLYLANTGQSYPKLPTSEAAVVHAREVADTVRRGVAVNASP